MALDSQTAHALDEMQEMSATDRHGRAALLQARMDRQQYECLIDDLLDLRRQRMYSEGSDRIAEAESINELPRELEKGT